MIRQNIILGNFTYIVDLYKANSDLRSDSHYEEFVVFKTTNFINNVMSDKDVFFVKKSIIENCRKDDNSIDLEMLGKMIAFPITNDLITMAYSANYQAFNINYNENLFESFDENYMLTMHSNDLSTNSSVLCDKLRIWLPITNSKLQSIIHVSNIINDVRFHYVCENLDIYETNSNGELKIGNDIYSEYIELWIPNIEDLFTPSRHYVKEMNNVSKMKQKIMYKESENEYLTIYPCVYYENIGGEVVKKMSIEAFRTYEFNEDYSLYLYKNINAPIVQVTKLAWNVMSTSLNETIENTDDFMLLLVDDTKIDYNGQLNDNSNTALIPEEAVINKYDIYESEIMYENNALYCSTFLMVLPFVIENSDLQTYKTYIDSNKEILDNILANPIVVSLHPFSKINEATRTYEEDNDVENSDVFTFSKDIKMSINFEFNSDTDDLSNYGVYMLNCKFNYPNVQRTYLEKNKLSMYDYLSANIVENGDYDDDIFNPKIDKCGYVIEISNDSTFKTILYEYVINMEIVDRNSTIIEDTKFKLNFDLNNSMWNSYPESLVIRVKYVDKVSYTIIGSNPLFITKENFKYIINYDDSRLVLLDNSQIYYLAEDEQQEHPYSNQYGSNKYSDKLKEMAINFIDKIQCTIIDKEQDSANNLTSSKANQRIIYKPIFYKVKDLQQIKLKNGITQNIGLNLSDILSKVDTFKVVINGIEYPEVARNDAYVIFKINSQDLTTTSGQYNLIDQDDQFISDGTWYIY